MRDLGFADLAAYLVARRDEGASAHRVRVELGCGGSVAVRLIEAALSDRPEGDR